MQEVKFLDLHHQYLSIKEDIDDAMSNVMRTSAYIGGKYIEQFEKNFSAYLGTNHCIGVGNGTDALEIALWSLNMSEGSEVIVPANSFIASSEAVSRCGYKVVFADIDENYLLDVDKLSTLISEKTAAIMVVHLYGQAVNMKTVMDIAKAHNLKVIEDCAQAHGAEYKGQKVGSFGDIATFSFYPGKNLGAYGDGGAIVTLDVALAEKCRAYSNHGRTSKFSHEIEGRNSRLDGLQAAVLDVKLKSLPLWIEKRNRVADYYLKHIDQNKFILPKRDMASSHVWHLFVLRHNSRDEICEYMKSKGIGMGIHYPQALPNLRAYEKHPQDCSQYRACKWDKTLFSIPIGEHLREDEIRYIVETLNAF